ITQKNAQVFANVFVGRAKPWVIQLPLADLKPAEADLVAQIAVLSVFVVPHPPATQLSILKWAGEGGRLGRIPSPSLEAVAKGVERWNGKWRHALKREVAELPEPLVEALRLETPATEPGAPAAAPEAPSAGEEGEPEES